MNTRALPLSTLLYAGGATVAVAALVALAAVKLFDARSSELRAERGWTQSPADTQQTIAAQADRLAHYAWIDRPKNVLSIPIERAMALCVDDEQRAPDGAKVNK